MVIGNRMFGFGKKSVLPSVDEALPGRAEEMSAPDIHAVSGNPLHGYFAEKYHQQYLHKNPDGYGSLQSAGVSCAAPLLQAVVQ